MIERLASIDIGTNSAILLIAEKRGPGLEPFQQRIATPRVGRNLKATGVIAEEAFEALMESLEDFRQEIKNCSATLVGVVATQAFRVARNGPVLLKKISALLGVEARIIAGSEESRLSYLAVADQYDLYNLAVLDIGGGSTEVTRKGGGQSVSIGAVSLLEACGSNAEACRDRAAKVFKGALKNSQGYTDLVAVGGTASALAMLELKLPVFDASVIEGLHLDLGKVTARIDSLASLSNKERAALPGMDPGRVDILLPGLCILEALLQTLGCTDFLVSDRGIRYGVILDWLKRQPIQIQPVLP